MLRNQSPSYTISKQQLWLWNQEFTLATCFKSGQNKRVGPVAAASHGMAEQHKALAARDPRPRIPSTSSASGPQSWAHYYLLDRGAVTHEEQNFIARLSYVAQDAPLTARRVILQQMILLSRSANSVTVSLVRYCFLWRKGLFRCWFEVF